MKSISWLQKVFRTYAGPGY